MDWKAGPLYMLDFEGSPSSGVVEFGVVELRGGAVCTVSTATCQPRGPIRSKDRDVHGLGSDQLASREPFEAYYADFVGYRRAGVFAAHNRHAENTFLKETWALPPRVPDPLGGAVPVQQWGPWVDTLALYRHAYPGLVGYGLSDLVTTFKLCERLERLAAEHCPPDRQRPHCALYDALASSLLLLRLEEEPSFANRMTIRWLLQASVMGASQEEFLL
jgi:DNA polymerase-3 subunit epsilon